MTFEEYISELKKVIQEELDVIQDGFLKIKEAVDDMEEGDRKAIEDEVWEFAKKIGSFNGLSKYDLGECFGHTTIQGVMTTYDIYREAKRKYEEWRKQKDEIRVGDEVEYECDGIVRFVVTGFCGETAFGFKYQCDYDDVGEYCDIEDLRKTGRHFDEVAELLEKMRDAE